MTKRLNPNCVSPRWINPNSSVCCQENSQQTLVLMLASKPLVFWLSTHFFIWYKVYIYGKSIPKKLEQNQAQKYVLIFCCYAKSAPKNVETGVSTLSQNRVSISPNRTPILAVSEIQILSHTTTLTHLITFYPNTSKLTL